MWNKMQGRIDFNLPLAALMPEGNADPVELPERIAALIRAELGPSCILVEVPSFSWPPGRFLNCEGFAIVRWQLGGLAAAKPDRSEDGAFSAAVLDRIDALLDGVQRRLDSLWADGRVFQEQEDAKERLESFVAVPENIRTLVKMARRALELEAGAGKLRAIVEKKETGNTSALLIALGEWLYAGKTPPPVETLIDGIADSMKAEEGGAGVAGAVGIVNEALDGPLPLTGCVGGADLEAVRQRVAALRERCKALEEAGDAAPALMSRLLNARYSDVWAARSAAVDEWFSKWAAAKGSRP